MQSKILVFIAMAALIAFLGVVIGFVAEPDLVIVTTLIVALASHDFWISVFKKNGGKPAMSTIPLESLPTGVSGKPVTRKKKSPAKKKPPARRKTSKRKK